MKNFRRAALASVVNLAITGAPDAFAAAGKPDVDALERRIRELESRLERLDKAAAAPTTAPAANPEVEKLTRKVNTLERKIEVDREVAANNATKTPKLEAGPNGFKLSSANGKHELRLGGLVHADGRFFAEDDNFKSTDRFEISRARIVLEAKVFNDVYFRVMPDFASSSNILPDAYIDYAYTPYAQLLAGKFKAPVSLERLQSASNLTFLERAFPTALAPNRDVGIEIHGGFGYPGYKAEKVAGPVDTKNAFSYQLGVFNGSGDSGNPDKSGAESSGNDRKEFDGRLFAHPFQHSGYSWLEGLGVGIAGSLGDAQKEGINKLTTSIGKTTFLDYTKDMLAGVAAPVSDGATYRVYPQAYWYAGPFGVMGEYVWSSQNLLSTDAKKQPLNVHQINKAWQILASYVLTGEDNSFNAIKPFSPFNPWEGNWGAFQVAARWTGLDVDDTTFQILDPNKAATRANAWALGVNWYLNDNAKILADYEQTSFEGGAANGGDRPAEHVFATRFQVAF